MAYIHLRGIGYLQGITPQQYTLLQQQLFALQQQLNAENQAWNFAVANSNNPPASDQHNVTVNQLNQQIAAVMQQLQQPVDWASVAPPAPSAALMAPAPGAPPGGSTIAPAPAPAAYTVQASAAPPLTPSELATSNVEIQAGDTMLDASGNVIPKPDHSKLWMLIAAVGAVYLGS